MADREMAQKRAEIVDAAVEPSTVALVAKALIKELKKTGAEIEPGEYRVAADVQYHIEAHLAKGEDVEYTPTADIPLIPTLAMALKFAGCTREKAMDVLFQAMTEALEAGKRGAAYINDRVEDVEVAQARVVALAKKLPKKSRQGAVRVKSSEVKLTSFRGTVEEL